MIGGCFGLVVVFVGRITTRGWWWVEVWKGLIIYLDPMKPYPHTAGLGTIVAVDEGKNRS